MTDIPEAPYIDNPSAPDVYADTVGGWYRFGPNVKITLLGFRPNHTTNHGHVNRVVIGRLVMPIDQAEELAKGLLNFIEGERVRAKATGPATVQ
jgi:hypothetical protein